VVAHSRSIYHEHNWVALRTVCSSTSLSTARPRRASS
jgi:hypothetical protein